MKRKVFKSALIAVAYIGLAANVVNAVSYTEEYAGSQKVELGETFNFGFDFWVENNDPNTNDTSDLELIIDAESSDLRWNSAKLFIDFYDGDNDSDTAIIKLTPWINSNTENFGTTIDLGEVSFPDGSDGENISYFYFSHTFTIAELLAFDQGWGSVAISAYGSDSSNDFTIKRVSIVVNAEPRNADPVPEPTTMLLFGTGLVGLSAAKRRKKG